MNKQDYIVLRLMGMLMFSIIGLVLSLLYNATMFVQYFLHDYPITYTPIIFLISMFYLTLGTFVYLGEFVSTKNNG